MQGALRSGGIDSVTLRGGAAGRRGGVAAVAAAARSRVWCTCAAAPLASFQGDPQFAEQVFYVFDGIVRRSFHFCTIPRSPIYRYSPKRGYNYYLYTSEIYDSTLWTPTLLVHHLLSQSSRLTRQIDMRQARDIVSP